MSLTPNFLSGQQQTFIGAANSNSTVNAITMNMNNLNNELRCVQPHGVINATTPTNLTNSGIVGQNLNKNNNTLASTQQQQQQQLYHLIPIAASNLNTLQLCGHGLQTPNATNLNNCKNSNNNTQGTTATVSNIKICNNNSVQQQPQQFTLEMQTNIAQIIGTALPIQSVNVSSGGMTASYGATTVKSLPVQGLAVVQNSMAPVINTTNATIIQLPATGNLPRVIAPAPAAAATLTTMSTPGTFSMINPNLNTKLQTSQFVINSGAPKPAAIKLSAATISTALPSKTKIIEVKSMDLEMSKPKTLATIVATPTTNRQVSKPVAAEATTPAITLPKQTAITTAIADKMQATAKIMEKLAPRPPAISAAPATNVNSNKTLQTLQSMPQISEINLEKLLPETTITKEPITVATANSAANNSNNSTNNNNKPTTLTLNVLNESNNTELKITKMNVYTENSDKPVDMLVIDDSSDAESTNADADDVADEPDELSKSPPRIRHISNSVVLTKADVRASSSTRQQMSSEPANVVLMKLPNAMQQTGGGAKPQNVAIPINEALTMAKEHLKSGSVNEPRPVFLQRSNSIPEAQKTVSPRAEKRSQSLNCGGSAEKLNAQKHCKVQVVNAADDDEHETKNSSSNELNTSNAEITFIELDDSFDEDYTDESESSKTTTPQKTDNKNQQKQQQEPPIQKTAQKCSQQVNANAATTLDKNDNIKPDQQQHQKKHQPQLTTKSQKVPQQQPSKKTFSKTLNDDKDEQIIKSLLCNEQITPSSSSSGSSLQEISPKARNIMKATTNSAARTNVASRAQHQPPPPQLQQQDQQAANKKNTNLNASAATTNSAATVSTPHAQARRICNDNKIATALSMVSTFDMLNWKENNIGTARGTAMRFELNEFNLLQLHERNCPPRFRIHAAYERPIYERTFGLTPKPEHSDPVLYMCRKCKTYGPAVDFLAPEFCSYTCLRRTGIKRTSQANNDVVDNFTAKRARKNLSTSLVSTTGSDVVASGSNSGGGGGGHAKSNSNPYATSNVPLPKFRWSNYLAAMRTAYAAPIDLFLNPFPTGPNPFSVGMKLEAIDPENCSLFCVCTVAEIKGYRMRLNFDGYDSIYDFWVNADSMDIFPPGWCEKTKRLLQPPRNYNGSNRQFSWHDYLRKTNASPADKKLFTHLNGGSMANRNPFQIGMFLEADDLNDTGKLCVASVADVLDERIRVHFDGWDDCYDYWVDISSPYIHPCGWHAGRQQLLVPPEYGNTSFNWHEYILEAHTGPAAPEEFFIAREPIDYRPGMKLEVVDPRNPSIIRPASVVHRTRHRVKIIFDCWPMDYTFVLEDDSPDLHPIGWCDATGHELEPPPGYLQFKKIMPCSTPGCRGIGNMNRNNGRSHATREACPYAPENWRTKYEKTPRVEGKQIMRAYTPSALATPQFQTLDKVEHKKYVSPESGTPAAMPTLKQRGRPRKIDRQPTSAARSEEQEKQHQPLIALDQIKSERKSIEPPSVFVPAPMPTTPQIKIEAVVSNGISAHKLAATQALEPHVATIKRFLCDYGPRLQQNYALWRENVAGLDIAAKVQQNPLHWTTSQACDFLNDVLGSCSAAANLGCDISTTFSKHNIDGAALLMLQQQDLIDILQFKLGLALKICAIILQLRILVATKYEAAANEESNSNKHLNSSFESETECSVN